MIRRWARIQIGCAAGLLLVAACSGRGDDPLARVEVLILVASSLTDAFAELETAFERATPGVDLVVGTGGSSALREQILAGAPAGVFASADSANMSLVSEAGLLEGEAVVFAHNTLQIAVPVGNPAGVTGLADFGREELLIGLCAEGVPCGDLGRRALETATVVPAIDSNEPNVRALLTKIEGGDLDAGIVYETDVASTPGEVDGIGFPGSEAVIAVYLIGVLADAPNPNEAAAFVAFALSESGQEILHRHGFMLP